MLSPRQFRHFYFLVAFQKSFLLATAFPQTMSIVFWLCLARALMTYLFSHYLPRQPQLNFLRKLMSCLTPHTSLLRERRANEDSYRVQDGQSTQIIHHPIGTFMCEEDPTAVFPLTSSILLSLDPSQCLVSSTPISPLFSIILEQKVCIN